LKAEFRGAPWNFHSGGNTNVNSTYHWRYVAIGEVLKVLLLQYVSVSELSYLHIYRFVAFPSEKYFEKARKLVSRK